MTREKRTAQVKSHITPSLREQLEMFVAERGKVVSMSDYLFEVIEQHIAMEEVKRRPAMRASHQRFGRRAQEA